jgi:exodeoxyribonuclease-3
VVSHTPIEVEHLGDTQEAGGWVDVTRADIPDGLLYSWWSYRAKDWDAADKGRRLDHIWASPDIASAAHGSRILATRADGSSLRTTRRSSRPSICDRPLGARAIARI